ncbi:MAG TPA: hypothetical protein VFT26_14890, partial [Pyrinomonadaceae bacterium]|nr:hypothetical protein [Pyrinomonadaceae bacterium]
MKSKVFVGLALIVVLFGACNRQRNNDFRLASSDSNSSAPVSGGGSAGVPAASYADVVSRVAPAVVTIHSRQRVRQPQQFPFMNDPFFRRFFGERSPQSPGEQQRSGLGSGVIVDANGYIVTNHHVVDGAEEIKVDL